MKVEKQTLNKNYLIETVTAVCTYHILQVKKAFFNVCVQNVPLNISLTLKNLHETANGSMRHFPGKFGFFPVTSWKFLSH